MNNRKFVILLIIVLIFVGYFLMLPGKIYEIFGKSYNLILEENDINPNSVLFTTDNHENEVLGFYDIPTKSNSKVGVFVLEKTYFKKYKLKERAMYASSEISQLYFNYIKSVSVVYGELMDQNITDIIVINSSNEEKANIMRTSTKTIWYINNFKLQSDEVTLKGSNSNGKVIYFEKIIISDQSLSGTNESR